MRKQRIVFCIAVVAATVMALGGCIVPTNTHLMEMNRNGRWPEVERVGKDMLAHRSNFTFSQTSETYFHVLYALTRMGRNEDAVRLMEEYDKHAVEGAVTPDLLWLGREITRLKDELGLLDEATRVLFAALEENGRGNHAHARELCESVLGMEGINDVQRATAHFVAAVTSIRLNDAVAAETHLAAFDVLKTALPPGHQALIDEPHARQGLLELGAASPRSTTAR